MKYEVIFSENVAELEACICCRLDAGWLLQGGVAAVATSVGHYRVFQAIVKEEPYPKYPGGIQESGERLDVINPY